MIEEELVIPNALGLHARPAALLAEAAGKFRSAVIISKDGVEVNAKSIMGLMLLAAEFGSKVKIRVDGPDELQTVMALRQLFQKKFGEK